MTRSRATMLHPVAAWMVTVIAAVLVVGLMAAQPAFAEEEHESSCSAATLRGSYVFNASGSVILATGPAPKAVVEFLRFNGDGTLTSIATPNVNGNVLAHFVHGTGSYAVNEDCTGTLTFTPSGITFDIFVEPSGAKIHMIQTNPGNVLAGEVKRITHSRQW